MLYDDYEYNRGMEILIEVFKTIGFIIFYGFGFIGGLMLGVWCWIDKRKKSKILNQLTFDEKYEYEKAGYLVLSPKGDTQDFIFAPPEHMSSCGNAYFGMSLDGHKYVDRYKGISHSHFSGGVLGLEDCVRLRDHLNKHIEAANKKPV